MATTNYARLFIYSWKFLALTTLLGTALAVVFSFLVPLRYSSTERLLITQTNSVGVDPYTAIKSTERIAENLIEVINTTSFYKGVIADTKVDASYFPADEISKRQKWADTIDASVNSGTGILSITAYHTSRDQAQQIAVDVAQELVNIAPNYFGYSVRVQIIDDPLPSRFYAKPDFLKNALFGAIAGILLGMTWVLGRVKNPS